MPGLNAPRVARKIARECPCVRVRQASRALTRVYDDALRPVGLQMSQFSVLIAIASFAPAAGAGATISAVASSLVMDRTTLTRNLRPLERSGWVRITRAQGDARARLVVLTHRGEKLIEQAYPFWEAALGRVRRTLGATKLRTLNAQLSVVVVNAPRLADVGSSSRR
jgi:DNA-binding MarR family transcriptional regulator